MKKILGSREEKRNSSQIHNKIRRARFVSDENDSGTFKYSARHKINIKFKKVFLNTKRRINSIKQKLSLWASNVDWPIVKKDLINWILNTFLEGLSINFATWALFKAEFTPATILAYGIVVNQGVSIYWRLRRHGSSTKIPNKNK